MVYNLNESHRAVYIEELEKSKNIGRDLTFEEKILLNEE